jgi:D-glycerate 3-kinase
MDQVMTPVFDPRYKALFGRWLASKAHGHNVPLFGIAGTQGSGKSSLAAYLAYELGFAHVSLDDFYHTKAHRLDLSQKVHPLFATRGQPISHDLELANETIDRLLFATPRDKTPLPVFDKLADDRKPHDHWAVFEGKPHAILVEGWCLGALPMAACDLAASVNDFEAHHDSDGTWRKVWAAQLAGPYQTLFDRFDAILFLKAQRFECVLEWRCEQEAELMCTSLSQLPLERRQALTTFVAQFERLTRHMMTGGIRATAIAELDEQRRVQQIVDVNQPQEL